jgi:ectoine hydroxylase-related dioxygenase (phytanoyl-CoA dioxygenase family)
VPDTLAHYTLLVMVALSDVQQDDAGNFCVWPGTHRQYEQYFGEHDVRRMIRGAPRLDALPTPVQIHAKIGDVVLAHYELLHAAAINVSPHPRYAVFFRLSHRDHHTQGLDILADIWREYAGLRELADQ